MITITHAEWVDYFGVQESGEMNMMFHKLPYFTYSEIRENMK